MQVIIYKVADGELVVVSPSAKVVSRDGVEAIAARVVPDGALWRAVAASELPADPSRKWSVTDDVLRDWSRPFVVNVAPPDPAVVRAGMRLSFAQLLIGLVAEKWITDAEGEAWLEAKLPAALRAVIATLPQEHQFPARARALRPSQIERLDPMVDMLGAAQGVSPEEMDEFFTKYMAV